MPNNEGIPPGAEQQPLPTERIPPTLCVTTTPPDMVTPHRITTIAFIVDFLSMKQAASLTPSDRTRISLLVLNLIQFPDENLSSTVDRLVRAVSPPILGAWAKRMLSVQEKGIAGLMDLFQAVEKLIIEDGALVKKKSLVGILLRRMYLQFDKMSFSEVSTLQVRFNTYFSAASKLINKLLEEKKNESDLDISLDDYSLPSVVPKQFHLASDEPEAKIMTRRQADLFIARQSNLLQYSEGNALQPVELQRELEVILKSNPGLPEVYFLSYLNYLRLNEFVGAVDSLYASSSHLINTGSSKLSNDEVNKNFRYANLNLASLHARLGHNSEALAAVREAITIGQDTKDHVCLQHALSWLTRVAPENSIALLQRSIAKCEELSLSYLTSLGMLSLCRFVEEFGDRPGYILNLLTRSAVLNCTHSFVDLQANSFLMRGIVWSTWGRPMMSSTVTQLLLKDSSKDGVNYQGEQTVLGLMNLAMSLEHEGFRSEADSVISWCETTFPSTSSQFSKVWKLGKQKILYARHLIAGNWVKAESSLSLLSALLSPQDPQVDLFRAELLFRQGNFESARDTIQGIIAAYDKMDLKKAAPTQSRETLIRSLILLSDIQIMCNDPGGAVEHLLRAQSLSSSHRLELLYCLGVLHLANLQLLLTAPARALGLVRHCLTFLLSHGTLRDRSRGLLVCAKCRVAASAELLDVERRTELLEGVGQVGVAKEGFVQLQDWDRVKDCLYLQARLYHSLGLGQQRNMAAQQYKKMDELYPTVSPVHQLLLI